VFIRRNGDSNLKNKKIENEKSYLDPTTSIFSTRLSDLISKIKKPMKLLAKEIRVPAGSLSKYQNDCAEPGIISLAKIAKYFNVSSDYLLGLTDVQTNDIEIRDICEKMGLSENSIDAIKVFSKNIHLKDSFEFILQQEYFMNLITLLHNVEFYNLHKTGPFFAETNMVPAPAISKYAIGNKVDTVELQKNVIRGFGKGSAIIGAKQAVRFQIYLTQNSLNQMINKLIQEDRDLESISIT